MRSWIKRHGRIFEINVPFFGRTVVVSDPALVRLVWTTGAEQLVNIAAEYRQFGWGLGRCSRLTTSRIAIGAGCSRRHFTVSASRATNR